MTLAFTNAAHLVEKGQDRGRSLIELFPNVFAKS